MFQVYNLMQLSKTLHLVVVYSLYMKKKFQIANATTKETEIEINH